MQAKHYRLLAADGSEFMSSAPGTFGGFRPGRIYGRLDCRSALRFLAQGGYAHGRVFFADEAVAIAAGFRPCGHCLRARYGEWKRGGVPGTKEYPWLVLPGSLKRTKKQGVQG